MVENASSSETQATEETTYRTEHFEAIPYEGDTYILTHRDKGGVIACGRTFPAEIAIHALEAIEAGFLHGVKASHESMKTGFSRLLQEQASILKKPLNPETIVGKIQ